MIDLRNGALPDYLEVDGERFRIVTDFRVWIAINDFVLTEKAVPLSFFVDDVPQGDWFPAFQEFLLCRPVTPTGSSDVSAQDPFDFVRDGDYLVGSFMHAYGIDLTDPALSMHWHLFLSLFRCLPSDTKMAQIEGYRMWTSSKKKPETVYKEMQRAYTLPPRKTREDDDIIQWQKQAFGKVLERFQKAGNATDR